MDGRNSLRYLYFLMVFHTNKHGSGENLIRVRQRYIFF